jgi:hypothetical protein
MRPECPAALSAPWSAHVPVPIGGAIDRGLVNLFIFRDICNFNIIFNLVVGPTCHRNLHNTIQRVSCLMIELDLYIYLFSMGLRSFEIPYVALLNSANRAS